MTSTAPVAMTRPVPYLSATAPAIGCVMPHMSCAQANARLIAAMPRPVAELSGPIKSATDWRTPKMSANTSPAATMIQVCLRVIIAPFLYDERHIKSQKNSSGGVANKPARRLANGPGETRIVHRARDQQRADEAAEDRHRLVAVARLAPTRHLPLHQADEILDAPGRRAAHFRRLARDFTGRRSDGAAQALLRRVEVSVRKVAVDERAELLAGLRGGHRPGQVLDRLGARAVRGLREQRVARIEVGVEAAVREPGLLHHLSDSEPLVTVLADRARSSANDALVALFLSRGGLFHGRRLYMTVIILRFRTRRQRTSW